MPPPRRRCRAAPRPARAVEIADRRRRSALRPWPSRLGDWLGASGWRVSGVDLMSSFGERSAFRMRSPRPASTSPTRCSTSIRKQQAQLALDRIAVTRSLHELWHFRGEVFGEVSRRHDQAEAERRLAALDRHFVPRSALAAGALARAPAAPARERARALTVKLRLRRRAAARRGSPSCRARRRCGATARTSSSRGRRSSAARSTSGRPRPTS